MRVTADTVLEFWFTEASPADWFERSDAFDAKIRERFAGALEAARAGGLDDWAATPRGCLALIILIDQFSRNLYRDSPEAWSADPTVLALTRRALEAGHDAELGKDERKFLYMPLMHSEALADQEDCVRLFRELADGDAEDISLDFAVRHRDIVARFGRFPHRNETLGRASTAEEIAFLEEPNSSF